MIQYSVLLTIPLLFISIAAAAHEDIPLSLFPLYKQATFDVGFCASSASSTLSISFGCPNSNPAACLCTNAASSLQVATLIRSCVAEEETNKQTTTATELWASYCLTNAGVSARDETLVDDLPLFTQVSEQVAYCVTQNTETFITSYGCNGVERAPCLCDDPASSQAVVDAISTCIVDGVATSQSLSGSALFSSFCEVNLQRAPTRTVGQPISVSGMHTPLSRLLDRATFTGFLDAIGLSVTNLD